MLYGEAVATTNICVLSDINLLIAFMNDNLRTEMIMVH